MASTRQIQIYHDPDVSNDYSAMSKPRPRLQPSALPLQPTMNTNMNQNVVLNPPESHQYHQSPLKGANGMAGHQPVYPNPLRYVPIPPPSNPLMMYDSPLKKPIAPPARPLMQPMIQQQPLFTTFHSVPTSNTNLEKENYAAASTYNDNFAEFPDPTYGRKQANKRTMDSAPIINQTFKKARNEEILTQLPEPEDMPVIEDDGCKPNYSYAHLIGMAILRSPQRQLTLAQIYKWISETFSFYQTHESGWHNSIRHNLSLHKAFQKKERPKDDPGKGNYWVIQPGMEMQFVKERPQRNKVLGMSSSQNNIAEDPMRSFQGTLKPPTIAAATLPSTTSHSIPALPELNSDETIPASDPALNEDDGNVEESHPTEPDVLHSSPPQEINSSPPVIVSHENGTPDGSHLARPSSSHVQNRKRKVDMDDSGYFSSLESSVLRPNKTSKLLTSEADRPRKKRGRAEEEIARIRSSSHDITPDKLRFKPRNEDLLLTSSPLRQMLPPVTPTPAIVFKKPIKAPPSLSPNTNLRQHRQKVQELMASPTKSYGLTGEEFNWSPAFNIHDSASHDNFQSHFDIFADTIITTTPGFISPLKRSAKAPTINRPTTSCGVLGDITPLSSRLNAKSARVSKLSNTVAASGSPLKLSESANLMLPQEDLFDFGSFDDENLDTADGFDILQGFQKIGDGDPLQTPSIKKSRPGMGRSATSRF